MLAVLAVQPQPRRGAVQVDDTRSIQDYLGHKGHQAYGALYGAVAEAI